MRGFGGTLGLYRHGRGYLYRTPLGLKAAASLIGAGLVVTLRMPTLTGIALAGVVAVLMTGAGLTVARILGMLLPLAPVLAVLGAYQFLSRGWVQAFVVTGGIVTCLLAARLLTLTTPLQDLLDGVTRLVSPLRRVGADPERFALALSVMLRSIPYLAGLFTDVRAAARARGLERSPRLVVTPVVIGAVAYAHRTGEALTARGLGDGRTQDDEGLRTP